MLRGEGTFSVAPLDDSGSRETKPLLKDPAFFQEVYEGSLSERNFCSPTPESYGPSPKGLETTQMEESFIHSLLLAFPGDWLHTDRLHL